MKKRITSKESENIIEKAINNKIKELDHNKQMIEKDMYVVNLIEEKASQYSSEEMKEEVWRIINTPTGSSNSFFSYTGA